MKIKNYLISILLLLFIIGYGRDLNSQNKSNVRFDDSTDTKLFIQQHDSITAFVEQEFFYYAPKAGVLNLAWYVDNYPIDNSVLWNDNTKTAYGVMYNPMEAIGDTFYIKLKVPVGAKVRYYFWISKNKQGHYQDYWDFQSSGEIDISGITEPIIKNAIYSKEEEKKESIAIGFGWRIFLLLSVVAALIYWVDKKWISVTNSALIFEKMLFMGLSLFIFHGLARSEIIEVNPTTVNHYPGIVFKILRSSSNDFKYVVSLVITFLLVLILIRNMKIRKWVYGFFFFLVMFSTLFAFTNIGTVAWFGKPFSYQWLYYSEFLGGIEAKTVLRENLSLLTITNLICLCFSVILLSYVLQITYKWLVLKKQIKLIAFPVIGLILIFVLIKVKNINKTWTSGQSENAIISMVFSIINANSNSTFFTENIDDGSEPFNLLQSTTLDTLKVTFKDHNVKNVLFIILESAGAPYFDSYGGKYQLSPNLNNYAKHAIKFGQMYSHAPVTDRSLVSILGSMYPFLSYKSLTKEKPDFDHPTISSVLKNIGYRTSFFTSADITFQDCDKFLAHRGFDIIEDFSVIKCAEEFKLDRSDYKQGNGIDDMCLLDRLTSWLDEENPEQNFFSMIWTVQGHYPYFFEQEEEDFGVSDYNFNRYLNCLKYNDKLIGNVMKALEVRGLDSSTLVLVTGDHGEAFGQHGKFGHGSCLYEEFVKVPLYLINPVLFHGEQMDDITGLKDLAPTALSVLNVDIPKMWQGRNILNTNSDETFYFATLSDYLFGYRKDSIKFIFNETNKIVEVYNLNSDPYEKINLANSGIDENVTLARNRVAAWVQYQYKYFKQILK